MKKKLEELQRKIPSDSDPSLLYKNIVVFGKNFPSLPTAHHISKNIVQGCQSTLYLSHTFENGKIYFSFYTDALISRGLAAILVHLYSGIDPKILFTSPLSSIDAFHFFSKISIQRQTGILHMYKKMQFLATSYI